MYRDAGYWISMAAMITFVVAISGAIVWSLIFSVYSGILIFFGLLVVFPFSMFFGITAISWWKNRNNA